MIIDGWRRLDTKDAGRTLKNAIAGSPKLVPNDIEGQVRNVSPPSMHSQLLHLFT